MEILNDDLAVVSLSDEAIICTLKREFVPMEQFKQLFALIGDKVKQYGAKKLVFDKRSLKVFHQPSMEWYHVSWKPETARYGLKIYRKILPQDPIFRKSVEIGRERITREHPEFQLSDYDIQYCESVEEALVS